MGSRLGRAQVGVYSTGGRGAAAADRRRMRRLGPLLVACRHVREDVSVFSALSLQCRFRSASQGASSSVFGCQGTGGDLCLWAAFLLIWYLRPYNLRTPCV